MYIGKFLYIYHIILKTIKMVRTTSYSHYKKLKSKGVNVQFVTKQELNK